MELHERRLEHLSGLKCRIFTGMLQSQRSAKQAMVISFEGEYGIGSGGNNDARFMKPMTVAALQAWHVSALIFDLRQMRYEWGDALASVFNVRGDRFKQPGFAVIVASDQNRAAIEGLLHFAGMESADWLVSSLEDAVQMIEDRLTNAHL